MGHMCKKNVIQLLTMEFLINDIGSMCHNIRWEMQHNFETYFDNDFQNKVCTYSLIQLFHSYKSVV